MAAGVRFPKNIDLVTKTADGRCSLKMIEDRPWADLDGQLRELQAKINTYVEYVVGGQLARDFPSVAGSPVEIVLQCASPPPTELDDAATRAAQALEPYAIDFRWELL